MELSDGDWPLECCCWQDNYGDMSAMGRNGSCESIPWLKKSIIIRGGGGYTKMERKRMTGTRMK
ncbi:hypothetical protein E2C01_060738 [Portunus trituberculatus]|uniref:Uncharacterized protein n=1 Tax=Portunus trituberculatus TaxID=210409 RepID=A0A5B7H9V6_PORTR|nr:hypothetical protein [Portunus trituberculatus]